MLGACFGSLCLLGISQGMRHAAAAILTFAVAFAFYDVKLFRRSWTMPFIAALLNAFTGSVLLVRTGWEGTDLFSLSLGALNSLLSRRLWLQKQPDIDHLPQIYIVQQRIVIKHTT